MGNVLKKANLKTTKNRELILKIIKDTRHPISAEEIYKMALKKVDINLSTIYRTLNTLIANNILLKQVRQDGIAYYQFNDPHHKHLLICTHCKNEIPLDNCPLEKVINAISKDLNCKITGHSIELYGVCSNCLNKQ